MNRCLCPAVALDHCYHVETSTSVCVSQEGKSFILESDVVFTCWVFVVDDGLLKHATYSRRCDFGLYVQDNNSAYLIELKGKFINDAIEQINATINLLRPLLKNFSSVYARIVAFQSAPRSVKYSLTKLDRLMQREFKGDLDWTVEKTLINKISFLSEGL